MCSGTTSKATATWAHAPDGGVPLGGPASFGHPGRGGSLGFGDSESAVAFGYVVSHIRQDLADNRAGLLVQAVRACLG